MREIPFVTVQDVHKAASSKKLIFFGAGDIAEKTERKFQSMEFIVDNSPSLQGSEEMGVFIKSPEVLRDLSQEEYFVIICTTSFGEVSDQLIGIGWVPSKSFAVSPILNDLRVISELESCQRQLLFTSGSPPKDDLKSGGGIYQLDLNGGEWDYRKVYSGNCYDVIPYKNQYVTVDYQVGLVVLDKNFNVVKTGSIPKGARCHGIQYSEKHSSFFLASTGMDQVLIFNEELKFMDSISWTHKYERDQSARHHCNDLCVLGDSVYISMFSETGNWQRDVFDGAVIELDIPTKAVVGTVMKDLWMPHNISFHEGSLAVLDSLRGQLKMHNSQVVGEFSAFSRGLAFDGIYYFIGQSRNRNYSKFLGLSNNISIDTSIIIFDKETKVSRTVHLPSKLSEIHAIMLLN